METTVADLLDEMKTDRGLKADSHLAGLLGVAPPVVSKLRSGRLPLGPSLIIRIHLLTDIPVRELQDIAERAAAEVRELVAA